MTIHARGTFAVQLNPLEAYDASGEIPLGRISIDRQLRGELAVMSKGEMLTAMTGVEGLGGLRGTFVLQHSGTMTRGAQSLSISVAPHSGTDELVGLAGTMAIKIAKGAHQYDFAYTLPQQRDD